MPLLQLGELFFPPGQISLGRGCILLGRHVVQDHNIPLLEMEPVQMVEGVFCLKSTASVQVSGARET
jgi:hypothetical protein